MIQTRRGLTFGGPVGSQRVSNDPFRHETPAFHQLDQKPLGRALVSLGLEDFLKNHAMLIDCAPVPVRPTRDLYGDFVQMPDISGARLQSPQGASYQRAELDSPTPGSLV